MTEQKNNIFKSRTILAGLFLLFFTPIFVSWYLVFFTDFKPGNGGTQHGILISPPRKIDDLQLVDPLTGQLHTLYDKWTMFVALEGDCDQSCINDLYRMRQIRLATGNEALRLQRAIYFIDERAATKAVEIFKNYAGQLLLLPGNINEQQLAFFNIESIDRQHAIYLIDPAGFVMMVYPAETEPTGIIKDIKKLLRISKLD